MFSLSVQTCVGWTRRIHGSLHGGLRMAINELLGMIVRQGNMLHCRLSVCRTAPVLRVCYGDQGRLLHHRRQLRRPCLPGHVACRRHVYVCCRATRSALRGRLDDPKRKLASWRAGTRAMTADWMHRHNHQSPRGAPLNFIWRLPHETISERLLLNSAKDRGGFNLPEKLRTYLRRYAPAAAAWLGVASAVAIWVLVDPLPTKLL